MKRLLTLTLCFALSMNAFASDNGYKVVYDGGSLTDPKAGNKAEVYIGSDRIRLARDGKEVISISKCRDH